MAHPYSVQNLPEYRSLHARAGQFAHGIQDFHLVFEFAGMGSPGFRSWVFRANVQNRANAMDSFTMPSFRAKALSMMFGQRDRFIVLDAPIAESGVIELLVHDPRTGRALLALGLNGASPMGSPPQPFRRNMVAGHSDFSCPGTQRRPFLKFVIWQGSALMAPTRSTTATLRPGTTSTVTGRQRGGNDQGGGETETTTTHEWPAETETISGTDPARLQFNPNDFHMEQRTA
jgi:hypothetical protein